MSTHNIWFHGEIRKIVYVDTYFIYSSEKQLLRMSYIEASFADIYHDKRLLKYLCKIIMDWN